MVNGLAGERHFHLLLLLLLQFFQLIVIQLCFLPLFNKIKTPAVFCLLESFWCSGNHHIILIMQNNSTLVFLPSLLFVSPNKHCQAVLYATSALNHSAAKSRSSLSLAEINGSTPSVLVWMSSHGSWQRQNMNVLMVNGPYCECSSETSNRCTNSTNLNGDRQNYVT